MNPNNKTLLAQKKRQNQLMINVVDWLPNFLPVLDAIKQLNKPWCFEYFDCVKNEDRVYWEKNLHKPPLIGLGISIADIKSPDNYFVHRSMEMHFPSERLIRYLPKLLHGVKCENRVEVILEQAMSTLQIPCNEDVYLFFTRFTPVFRLPFSSITLLELDHIISREDICIMPPDYSWLIFKSLEDEWVWGKNN